MCSHFHTSTLCLAVFFWWYLKVTALLPQCWASLGPSGEHRSVLPQWLWPRSSPQFLKHCKLNPITMSIVKVKRECCKRATCHLTEMCRTGEKSHRPLGFKGGRSTFWSWNMNAPVFLEPCILYAPLPLSCSRTSQCNPGSSVATVVVCTPGLSPSH